MIFSEWIDCGNVKYGSTSDLDVSAHGEGNFFKICESVDRSNPSKFISCPIANTVWSVCSILTSDSSPFNPNLSISSLGSCTDVFGDNPGGKIAVVRC